MRPAARISALIELLGQVEEGIANRGAPADILVGKYFRERRYAGSKDRRAITGYLYDILRNREALLWLLADREVSPRNLAITHFALSVPEALELFGEEGTFAPMPLSDDEHEFIKNISQKNTPEQIESNLPSWARLGFERRFGASVVEAAAALNETAPLDLRINPLKEGVSFRGNLKKDLQDIENTNLSPLGIRSNRNVPLGNVKAYKQGKIEVQDEAAQLASLLVNANSGMQVADLCAGAGGKSLLVSALMENKGQLYAYDTSAKRLSECKKRADRGGNRNIQTKVLSEDTEKRVKALDFLKSSCDRVFVDVPCSGSGTWRRSPDQRWRQDENTLLELHKLQLSLLKEGASLVKDSGRLLYMTCSVLPEENEDIVKKFLESSEGGWELLDYKSVWRDAIGDNVPETLALMPETLQLAPHTHSTDGFFVAIFSRK